MEDWPLIERMVNHVSTHLPIPITCKIRIFDSVERTVAYARMICEAGCGLLTVHGRTRDQKGHLTGKCDWSVIRDVRESVEGCGMVVFSNGGIMSFEDVEGCLSETGCDGVMTAGMCYTVRV